MKFLKMQLTTLFLPIFCETCTLQHNSAQNLKLIYSFNVTDKVPKDNVLAIIKKKEKR